ncbi:MAG: STAS domain-containing protein [Acidobacteriales bacterium]|nr:STAS domain-containing protein [Terriglobales bacterium]
MLAIELEKADDVAVVRCTGRIVRGGELRTLRHAVVSAHDSRVIVLDLSDVETIDGGGLAALVSLRRWAQTRHVQFKLVNPSRFVREVLSRTRLDSIFDISSLHDALLVLAAVPNLMHYEARCA